MNRKIIVAVVVITGSGVFNSWMQKTPLTPVIIGSYVFMFVLAIMDTFGGPMSTFAGAMAMLAMTFVIITEVDWQAIIKIAQGKGSSSSGTAAPRKPDVIIPGSSASH